MHALALLAALTVAAAPAPVDGNAAFERLKQLDGSWKTDPKAGPVQYVSLRVIAGDTAVLETTTAADRTTITQVVIYSFEGTELIAVHYGTGGTSRLKLSQMDSNTLRFDGSAREARVAGLSMGLRENKLRQELLSREGGREVKKAADLLREYVDTLK